MRQFFGELKRRAVCKVAVTDAVVAFVAIRAADLLVPRATLPTRSGQPLIHLTVFGFLIVLVTAWAFEMTPQGIRRTRGADSEAGAAEMGRWWGS